MKTFFYRTFYLSKRIKVIKILEAPKNLEELRKILGMVNFLLTFLLKSEEILIPLNDLLKKVSVWQRDDIQQASLYKIETTLLDFFIAPNSYYIRN